MFWPLRTVTWLSVGSGRLGDVVGMVLVSGPPATSKIESGNLMMKSSFTRERAQVRCLLNAVSYCSDSEYELLLLIQISVSYNLNPTTIAFDSQNGKEPDSWVTQ